MDEENRHDFIGLFLHPRNPLGAIPVTYLQ